MVENESSAKTSGVSSSTVDIDSPLEVVEEKTEEKPERDIDLRSDVAEASMMEFQSTVNVKGIMTPEERDQAKFILNYLSTEVPRSQVMSHVRDLLATFGAPGLDSNLERLYRYVTIKHSIDLDKKQLREMRRGS